MAESLKIVIIGIVERHVYLNISGVMTGGMEQQETVMTPKGSPVKSVETIHYLIGCSDIVADSSPG